MWKNLVFLCGLFTPLMALAQPTCPKGNLLSAVKVARSNAITLGHRLTNNRAATDGTAWNGAQSSIFSKESSFAIFDLGSERSIAALALQGDNNDEYTFEISKDGKTFEPIWTVPLHPHPGLRTRVTQGLETSGRFLKIGVGSQGDGSYSVTEVQAFCQLPQVWPPAIQAALPKASKTKLSRKNRLGIKKLVVLGIGMLLLLSLLLLRKYSNAGHLTAGLYYSAIFFGLGLAIFMCFAVYNEPTLTSQRPKYLAIAMVCLMLVWAAISLFKAAKPAPRWFSRIALISILVSGGLTWTNFGSFHGSKAIHYWDTFHYYMGGKYFSENRYELLYQCSAIGEVDDGRRAEFEKRKIRDLRDNKLYPASLALTKEAECRAAFKDPARWKAFQQDLRLFRAQMGADWWAKMFKDHGFNATPVWTLFGKPLTDLGWAGIVPDDRLVDSPKNRKNKSASELRDIREQAKSDRAAFVNRIGWLVSIDGLLYAAGFAMIWWAFGLFGAAFAMLIWATGYPYAYFWTGGGFGRVPWWFMAVAGTCFLKRGYPMLGGAGITWSMLLRVFPGALIGGISLKVAHSLIKYRRLSREQLRIIAGCAIALVALVVASLPVVGGIDTYKEFLGNSFKHKGTPLTNHMGLPTVLSYNGNLIGRKTKDEKWAVITLKADRSELEGRLLTNDLTQPVVKLRKSDGNTIELKSADILSIEQDPFKKWKRGRQSTLASRKAVHYGLILLFLGMIWYAGRRLSNWELTALSTLLITSIFELTCYYYSYLVLFALLAMRRGLYMVAAVGMVIAGQVIQLDGGWYDEQYHWASVAVVLAQVFVLVGLCFEAYLADRGRSLAPPLTAGTDAVNPDVERDASISETPVSEHSTADIPTAKEPSPALN